MLTYQVLLGRIRSGTRPFFLPRLPPAATSAYAAQASFQSFLLFFLANIVWVAKVYRVPQKELDMCYFISVGSGKRTEISQQQKTVIHGQTLRCYLFC